MMTLLIIASFLIAAYLLIGVGFSLATWLRLAEEEMEIECGVISVWSVAPWVIIAWPIIAVYCYRTEISKTVKPIDFEQYKK